MRFINTELFSPVAMGVDLPREGDLFYHSPDSVLGLNTKALIEFHKENSIVIDDVWWERQFHRCINGYSVANTVEKGGDYLIDGKDALWSGNDVYLPEYETTIRDREVSITGRHYFYLNFWKIRRMMEGYASKQFSNPRFLALDFIFTRCLELMFKYGKDHQDVKGRQVGYSEKLAGMLLGYNYTFVPFSQNIIVAGEQTDADHTFLNCTKGIDNLANTQFRLKHTKKTGSTNPVLRSITKSEIIAEQANNDEQALSRYCLAKGTKVVMYDGEPKSVEDIVVGDMLMGPDSTPRTVEKTTYGYDNMYKISSSISDSFICNGAHLLYMRHVPLRRRHNVKRDDLYVTNNFNDKDILKVDDTHFLISAENYFKKSKTFKRYTKLEKSRAIEFPSKKIDIDAYFLGVWLGDGDSDMLRISTMDDDIVDYLHEYCKDNSLHLKFSPMYDPITKKQSKASRYFLSYLDENRKTSKSNLRKSFIKYNLFKNKHIPDDYLYNTKEVRMQLLAGLLDTDGWKSKDYSYCFAQVNERLAYQVKWLSESLGFQVCMSKRKNGIVNGYKGRDIYNLSISGEGIHEIPLKIKRKRLKSFNHKLQQNIARCLIERVDDNEYYGFTLDGDQLFLLNDFTITHNSPSIVVCEEVGKGKQGWSIKLAKYVKPSIVAEGNKRTGHILYLGTGGDMEDGVADLQERAYNPDEYDLLSFNNKWAKEGENYTGDVKVAHFIPKTAFRIVDSNGNPLVAESIKSIREEIDSKRREDKHVHIAANAIYLDDVFLSNTAVYVGPERVAMMGERKNDILTHRELQITRRGHLEWVKPGNIDGGVVFVDATDEDLLKGNWWLEIVEEPEKESTEKAVFENLYIGGTDTYMQDTAATSDSLGAMLVYKKARIGSMSPIFNTWVALLLERPGVDAGGQNRFFEHTLMLSIYYNLKNNIEYVNPLIFEYYEKKRASRYLMERPMLAFAGKINKELASNRYGTDKSLKPYKLVMWRDMLDVDQINRIFIIRILDAFMKYKNVKHYNCDITSAAAETAVGFEEMREWSVIDPEEEIEDYNGQWTEVDGVLQRIYI